MTTWRRLAGTVSASALVAGVLAAVPMGTAQAAGTDSGTIFGWSATEAVRYPSTDGPQGPWAKLAHSGSVESYMFPAIRPDGTLDVLAAPRASLGVVPPAVASGAVRSVSVGGPAAVWATLADGTLHKWGGKRGSIDDQAWTVAKLGGKAIEVSGSLGNAFVVVERADSSTVLVLVDGVGVFPVTRYTDDAELVDVVAINQVATSIFTKDLYAMAMTSTGKLVRVGGDVGWEEVSGIGEPVVAIGGAAPAGLALTASGKMWRYLVTVTDEPTTKPYPTAVWQDQAFPGLPAGEQVKEIVFDASASLALTQQGRVVSWDPKEDYDTHSTPVFVELPAEIRASSVVDLAAEVKRWAILGDENARTPLRVTAPPSFSGEVKVGGTLTSAPATFSGTPTEVSYEWFADQVPIAGATGSSWTLTDNEVGRTISVRATAMTDVSDVVMTMSAPSAPVPGLVNRTLPWITGTPQLGKTLSGFSGRWQPNNANLAFQWLRNGVAIAGATGETYQLVAADVGAKISLQVIGTNADVTKTVVSEETEQVQDGPPPIVNDTVPTVTGTAQVGKTLTADPGTWTPSDVTHAYQWLRGDDAITGATAATYKLVAADVGAQISVRVTATKGTDTLLATSAKTAAVADLPPVVNNTAPTVTGVAKVGKTLTASAGTWTPSDVTHAYQWLRGDDTIAGATASTYKLVAADLDAKISVQVTASKADFTDLAVKSAKTDTVTLEDLAISSAAAITGAPTVGGTLTGKPAEFSGGADSVSNQWLADGNAIEGQTGNTLALTSALKGKSITFRSTAKRGTESLESVSTAVGPVKATPTASVSATPGMYGTSAAVTVNVSDGATGEVTLTVAGQPMGAMTLTGGQAVFVLSPAVGPGSHALGVSYAGNGEFNAASAAGTLSVARGFAGRPTWRFTKAPTRKKAGTAVVTVASALGNADGIAHLVFKKGKKTKKVNVAVRNGVAAVKMPKLPKGKWTVVVTYSGSPLYVGSATGAIGFKVK